MVNVKSVLDKLEELAPLETKMEFDNVGLLVGSPDKIIEKIMLSLDITNDVIFEAKSTSAGLIVSHHPLFFSLKNITSDGEAGKKIISLIKNDISAVCMHTNLDAAKGGVNDILAEKAGIPRPELMNTEGYYNCEPFGIGRFGELASPVSFADYLLKIKSQLKANGLRYYDAGRPVYKVAVIGGSGGSDFPYVLQQGCDTFITADIKYDVFISAKEYGINLIDGGHYCTENVIIPTLQSFLSRSFPDLEVVISKNHGQIIEFI